MDKNENIELINDDGFGAASTQYLWRFSEYHGKLVIGTFDIATLASGIVAQLSRQKSKIFIMN